MFSSSKEITYVTLVGTNNIPGAVTKQIAGLASGEAFPVVLMWF
ncbi:hypothetical protein [uncultured Algibacter sp.]|nr:hypothetical protein [uncultured Algibacter sp.]